MMNLRKLTGVAVAAVLALPMFASHANAYELVIPTLDYRTGPYAPNGIPLANVGKLNDDSMFAPKFLENKLKFYPESIRSNINGLGKFAFKQSTLDQNASDG